MTIWIDAQLSPALALWIVQTFGVAALALRDVGLRDATDREIFLAAKQQSRIVMTKDADFVKLLDALGPPPQVNLDHVRKYFQRAPETVASNSFATSLGIVVVWRDHGRSKRPACAQR